MIPAPPKIVARARAEPRSADGAREDAVVPLHPNGHRWPDEPGELIVPDGTFVAEIIALGGRSLKKCFQCGTCSAACKIAHEPCGQTFPRKQLHEAQWGLKDRLAGDPSLWLCHQCNDCSQRCPRGANPGDVIAALRAYAILHFAYPAFLARAFADPGRLPFILALPAFLLLALLTATGHLAFPSGDIVYANLVPERAVALAGLILLGFVLITGGVGMWRFWRAISSRPDAVAGHVSDGPGALAVSTPTRGLPGSFAAAMLHILKHSDFRKCGAERNRYVAHLAIFYGTPFLLFATALAAGYHLAGRQTPLALADPAKVAGNVGAVLIFGGLNLVVYNRLARQGRTGGRGEYFDWLFIGLVYTAVLTGIVMELARYTGTAGLAYTVYLVHLVLVFTLIAYAPYGKFAHVVYRTLAMTYARHGGRGDPHEFYVLLAVALALGVGAVAALTGAGIALVSWTRLDQAVLAAWQAINLPALAGMLGSLSHIYLPVADVSVSSLVLVGLGFGVGCLSGLFGVGGGFLMTPLLMMVGVPAAPATASDSCQIAGASSSGAFTHWRIGNVDVKLGLTLLFGGLAGGTLGVQLVAMLRTIGGFNFWVKVTYILILGIVGFFMVRESVATLLKSWAQGIRERMIHELVREGYVELKAKLVPPTEATYRPFRSFMDRLPLQTTFVKAGMRCSYVFPLALGLLVGLLTAVMGVGGGFVMVPAMIYVLGVDTKVAVGTSLFQMVFTSVNVTYQQAVTNGTVDAMLAILLLVGSAVGAQVGTKLGRRLKGHQLRILLGLLVLLVTIKLITDLTLAPGMFISLSEASGGH